MITLHGQQKLLKRGNKNHLNRTNNAFNKLQSLNSSLAGLKADMFNIYLQESKSFVTSKQFKWKT